MNFAHAWTAGQGVTLQDEGEESIVLHTFTQLEVIGRESGGIRVRCQRCPQPVEAIVGPAEVVYEPLPPEVAAWGTLAEFALAVRTAAGSRDLESLRSVMVPDFSFSLIGPQTPDAAFDVWRAEDFATLEALPSLLDQGIVTPDSVIWSAPPAYTEDLRYRGLRTGFRRRADGRWEWLFLIGGVVR